MSSPEFKSEPKLEPQAISLEVLFNTPEFQSAIDQSVKAQLFDANNPDFIPDYKSSHTINEAGEKVFLTKEDEDFLNRPQADSVDLDEAHRKPSMDMSLLFAPAEQPEKEVSIRPLSAIVKDLHAEKAHTVKRQTIKSDGTKSKRFKEVSAVYQENIDPLLDELAVRVALEKTDYSVKGASEDDTRLNTVLELQRRTGLTDEEAIEILDRTAPIDDIITTAQNEIDEVILKDLVPAMELLATAGINPQSVLLDSEGNLTVLYLAADAKFTATLNAIENPLIRSKLLRDTNEELSKWQQKAYDRFIANAKPLPAPKPNPAPAPTPKPLAPKTPAPAPKPADSPKPTPVAPLSKPAKAVPLAPPQVSSKKDLPAPGKLPNSAPAPKPADSRIDVARNDAIDELLAIQIEINRAKEAREAKIEEHTAKIISRINAKYEALPSSDKPDSKNYKAIAQQKIEMLETGFRKFVKTAKKSKVSMDVLRNDTYYNGYDRALQILSIEMHGGNETKGAQTYKEEAEYMTKTLINVYNKKSLKSRVQRVLGKSAVSAGTASDQGKA